MWWPFAWLSLGFLAKWCREWWEKRGSAVFDFMLVGLSFTLVCVVFAVLHLTTWQALLVFLFWLVVILLIKAN